MVPRKNPERRGQNLPAGAGRHPMGADGRRAPQGDGHPVAAAVDSAAGNPVVAVHRVPFNGK